MSIKITFESLKAGEYYKAFKVMVGSKALRCGVKEKFMEFDRKDRGSADGGVIILCEKAYFHKGPYKLDKEGKVNYGQSED